MPLPEALAAPVHFSTLKHMARSPAHYRAAVLAPRESTPAMRLGTSVHAVVLGQPYVIWHGASRRGKEWDAFEAKHATSLILSEDEYQRALWCADALSNNRDAASLLRGAHEVECEWTAFGRRAAGRLDVLGDGYVTDLKTASSAHPETFVRAGLRLAYHAQLAWYLDGVRMPAGRGFIVAVEPSPPFAVTVFELSPRCLDEGRKLIRMWMEQLAQCESANEWPEYAQSIVPFDVPDHDEPTLIIDGEEVAA